MAVFNVQAPDGSVMRVQAPEGATQAQVLDFAKQAYGVKPQPEPVTTESVNKAAVEEIGNALPQGVKDVASTVGGVIGEGIKGGYEALPESTKGKLKTTGNFLLDTISVLDKGRQAVQSYGKNLYNSKAMDENPILAVLATGHEEATKKTIEDLKKGKSISTQELLSDEFRREHPVMSAAAGIAGDIITDPLKTGSIKALTTPVKPVVGQVVNTIQNVIPDEVLNNPVLRAFNVNTGDVAKAQTLYNNYRFLKERAVTEGVQQSKSWNNQIKMLAKTANIPEDQLKAQILNDIETGNIAGRGQSAAETLAAGADDPIEAIKQGMVERNRELLRLQQEAGVKIGDLGETYMPHVRTPESFTAQTADKLKSMFNPVKVSRNPQTLARELEGTVAEINARNIYGSDKFFRDDPAILMGTSEFNAASAIAGQKFLNDAKALGVNSVDAPANYVGVAGIDGVKFAPEVAARIGKSHSALTNNADVGKVLKLYDGATRWWKMWSLGARPAYHTKNMIGNMWNSYLGGVDNPVVYGQAGHFQVNLAKNKMEGTIAGLPMKTWYDEMSNRGIIGEGQYSGDIATTIEKKIEGGSKNPFTLSTENPVLQKGFQAGQIIEDNARIGMFMDQVKKGKTFDEAANHVRKYLFDYGDLSPTERDVFKRAMPFYTWSRKNLPLQLEALATQPDKINKINIVRENVQQASGVEQPDQSQVPEYIKEGMPIYTGNPAKGQVTAVRMADFLPFGDLNTLTKGLNTEGQPTTLPRGRLADTYSTAVSGLNPIIKSGIQAITNYDDFRKKNIQEYKGQTTDFLGVQMPVHLAKLASNIVMLNEIDRANPGGVFGTRTKDPVTGDITTTKGIFGNNREGRTDMTPEERSLQYLTGLKAYDIDTGKVEAQNASKLKSDISALKGLVRNAYKQSKMSQGAEVMNELTTFLDKYSEYTKERDKRMREEGSK